MKKLFTSVALALALMSASAENYTCPLAVSISGSDDIPAGDVTVSVTKQDNYLRLQFHQSFSNLR